MRLERHAALRIHAELARQCLVIDLKLLADRRVILIRKPQAEARAEIVVLRIRIIESVAFRAMTHQTGGDTPGILRILRRNHRLAHLRPERAGQLQSGHRACGNGLGRARRTGRHRNGGWGRCRVRTGLVLCRAVRQPRAGLGQRACIAGNTRIVNRHPGLRRRFLGLPQIVGGDTPVIGVLAVTFLDHGQRMPVSSNCIRIPSLGKAHLREARQCGGIMRGMFQMAGAIDFQRFGCMPMRALQLVFGQQGQRQIRVRAGHVDIRVRVHARGFDNAQRFTQLQFRLVGPIRLAVEHRQIVVQCCEPTVGGCQRMPADTLRLMIQILGLIVLLGRAHRGSAID